MKGTVTLNSKEQHRLAVLNRVIGGQMTAMEAARLLDLSERQTRRLLAAYRREGAAALAHGNRGRTPANALSEELRQQVVTLAKGTYAGINHQHLSELLAEREAIAISRPSLRRILLAAGLPSHRKRRPPKHRRRRERYPQEGMLLQLDASRHRWLGEDGPWLSLLAAIDDATGKVVGALFRQQEDAQGYFLLLQAIVKNYGRPLAVYHDAHGIFTRNDHQPLNLREQLAGTKEPTQFGRLLAELGIASITAHSPQAKGRVERLFGTFQERLVVELCLAGAKSAEEANRVLGASWRVSTVALPSSRPLRAGPTSRCPMACGWERCSALSTGVAWDRTIPCAWARCACRSSRAQAGAVMPGPRCRSTNGWMEASGSTTKAIC
jgi:transposase